MAPLSVNFAAAFARNARTPALEKSPRRNDGHGAQTESSGEARQSQDKRAQQQADHQRR